MSEEAVISKQSLVEGMIHAPVGIALFNAPDLTVRMVNPFYLQMVDRHESDLIGRPLFDVIPELKGQIESPVREVLQKKIPHVHNEMAARIRRRGRRETAYFNVVYQPVMDHEGQVESVMLIASEVTDIVREKLELLESEEKFRSMVSQCPVPMAILRASELVIEAANHAILQQFWNRDLHSVKGKKLFDAFPELKAQGFPEQFQRIFRTGEPCSEKARLVYIDGSPCNYVDLECTPLFNQDRSVSGVLMTVHDVSEEVRMRRKTEENEERLQMVIEASGLGTWELNLKTKAFTYSDEYLATFGIRERLSHDQLLAFMHPEDLAIRQAAFRRAFATGWLHYVSRLIWRDGSIHWIEAHGKVIYDEAGQPFKMMGTSRDITDEKVYEQSIRESEEKFRLLADSMRQLIWISDPNGNLMYFNQSVFDYCGLPFEQLKGQGWIKIVHPEDKAVNIRRWREAVKKGREFLFEHRFRRHDGVYRWQLSRATAQYDPSGRIQMWVGTSTDIHDQKTFAKELEEKVLERTRELKESNDALEKTNRELENFAYIASHDLQEPLRKIMTFSDILKKNIHDEASVRKYFSKIDSSAKRMGDLIKAVLEYSRLPAHPGQLMLTDLNEIVENVKTDLELTIADRNAVVESDDLPAIPGVPLQLHQLFSNLMGNALKFCNSTPHIMLRSRAVSGAEIQDLFKADETKQYVELRFSDNGIGFDNRYKEQIFTIFQRLHGWQQYSGTGIGLALCKKIAENHHGFITAESVSGKGSTFIVYLPA